MIFSQRIGGLVKATALALALAFPLAIAAMSVADARVGGGGSAGSRGARSFAPPPTTQTAPNAARPMDRTMAQPTRPNAGTPAAGGMFNRPGMGMLGGLAAGFLGAGLLGMLFGGGLFGGLGGLSSIIGLLLQVALIVIVVRLAMSWWQRRNQTQHAYAGPTPAQSGPQPAEFRSTGGFGANAATPAVAPLEIEQADYESFERLLGQVQAAWSNEEIGKLHTLATPEMVSYFTQDLEACKARGIINKVSDVKLLQGDLAEAWREGESDYASVAMRFSLVDRTFDRASGKLVDGSDEPAEATEVWTFVRPKGADWELSAIQQTA